MLAREYGFMQRAYSRSNSWAALEAHLAMALLEIKVRHSTHPNYLAASIVAAFNEGKGGALA